MTDLLNCPFCGGEMQLRYALWPSEGDRDAVIHNVPGGTSCPIEGAFSIDTFDNGVSVAEAWNRRPLLDELDASKAWALATPSTGAVGDQMVDAALAFWCAKLPKAQRETPIPELLREHMRGTLEAAMKASRSDTAAPASGRDTP
jgi:hypothetical protein